MDNQPNFGANARTAARTTTRAAHRSNGARAVAIARTDHPGSGTALPVIAGFLGYALVLPVMLLGAFVVSTFVM